MDKAENDYQKAFCILPFIHLNLRTTGSIRLCCRSKTEIGNLSKDTIKKVWNSPNIKKIRKQMLSGERSSACKTCWEHEDAGMRSLRQRKTDTNRRLLSPVLNTIHPDFSMPFNIPIIEMSLSNLCNLKCRMCLPPHSTAWFKDWNKIRDIYSAPFTGPNRYDQMKTKKLNNFDKDSFFENIKQLGPNFNILEFAGGEPLMDPMHYKVLKTVSPWAKNIQLKYATNLSRLKTNQFDALKEWTKFKSIDLSVSIDGYPELNEYIRTGSKTDELVDNFKKVRSSVRELTARVSLCQSVYNSLRLPECYDYFIKTLEIPVCNGYVDEPIFLNARILPAEIKKLLEKKFNQYIKDIEKGMYSMYPKAWSKRIIRLISDNLIYIKSKNLYEKHWPQFVAHTKRLDKIRNTNILRILTELSPYF